AGQFPRPGGGEGGGNGAQPNPIGAHRGRRQRSPSIDRPNAFPDEEAVPAVPFSQRGELGRMASIAAGHDESVAHLLQINAALRQAQTAGRIATSVLSGAIIMKTVHAPSSTSRPHRTNRIRLSAIRRRGKRVVEIYRDKA